jgi:hypothetical protein
VYESVNKVATTGFMRREPSTSDFGR